MLHDLLRVPNVKLILEKVLYCRSPPVAGVDPCSWLGWGHIVWLLSARTARTLSVSWLQKSSAKQSCLIPWTVLSFSRLSSTLENSRAALTTHYHKPQAVWKLVISATLLRCGLCSLHGFLSNLFKTSCLKYICYDQAKSILSDAAEPQIAGWNGYQSTDNIHWLPIIP